MIQKLLLVGCVFCLALSVSLVSVATAEEPPPPVRKIPGITAADPYPNACVDCHINDADKGAPTRFSILLERWAKEVAPNMRAKAEASAPEGLTIKGRHPKVTFALKDVPAKCLVCHGKAGKAAPPFATLLHSIHLVGGEENLFLAKYQGECTYCHKLDQATGRWSLPSAPAK